MTIVSKGFGSGSSRFFKFSYDPTLNTNNGGWKCQFWDGGSIVTLTVNDGSGGDGAAPIGQYRHLEFGYNPGSASQHIFIVEDEDANVIGSTKTSSISA